MSVLNGLLVELIQTHSLSTVFDVGCGRCNDIKSIFSGANAIPRYIGADIDPQIIESNRVHGKEFLLFDITKDPIPDDVDIVICRDILGHLTLDSVILALDQIRRSKAKFFVTTTFFGREFVHIKDKPWNLWSTQWRPMCFFTAPFYFPLPVKLLPELCSESYPTYIDKSLALWKVNQIPEFIPRKIFQLWHSKELPPLLKEAGERIRQENPDFEHHVYDSTECEQFIEEHFGKRVVEAYRKLVPVAYKTDLWRYCVLYVHGGIYLDISFEPINDFRFLQLIHKEHFSSEVILHPYRGDLYKGVSIGVMVAKAGNQRLLTCINKVVENIEKEDYGEGPYDITSAVVLGSCFTLEERKALTEVRRVVNIHLNGYSYKGAGIFRRIQEYDKGLPGRWGQAYLNHWFERTVFHPSESDRRPNEATLCVAESGPGPNEATQSVTESKKTESDPQVSRTE